MLAQMAQVAQEGLEGCSHGGNVIMRVMSL